MQIIFNPITVWDQWTLTEEKLKHVWADHNNILSIHKNITIISNQMYVTQQPSLLTNWKWCKNCLMAHRFAKYKAVSMVQYLF